MAESPLILQPNGRMAGFGFLVDNLTHTFTAVALSQAGLNRKTRFATLALVIGANLPDVDLLAELKGSTTYLEYHRGITHSLLGVTALAGLLALPLYALGRQRPSKGPAPRLNGGWLFLICWIATASHLLLDLSNSWGVRPFLPFDGRWCALDIMFIIDPLVWAILAAGLGMPMLFRLVSEEVGAKKPGYRRGATFSLWCLVLLWGLQGFAHRRALSLLNAHSYSEENPIRLGAFPSLVNPFVWTGVVETDSGFRVLDVNALEDGLEPEMARVYHKPETSPALAAALKTHTAEVFLGFARFPWAQVAREEEGFTVTIRDLRFVSLASQTRGFVTEIRLDNDLRIRSESFRFRARAAPGKF